MRYYTRKFRKFVERLPNKLVNWVAGISFFAVIAAYFGLDILKNIPAGGIADWAVSLENSFPNVVRNLGHPVVKVCISIVAVLSISIFICKHVMHPKALLVKHSSFSNALLDCDEDILKGYTVRCFEINLVEQMNSHDIVRAVQKQDEIIKKIKNGYDEYAEVVYYGIAHIPLIFRAGFQIGDEGKTRLLHKYRNGMTKFKEISTDTDNFSIQFNKKYNNRDNDSREMLVVIATSFPVSDQDLTVFRRKCLRCELCYEMAESAVYGVDSIESYEMMNRLKNLVLQDMRSVVAQNSIERIHLVLSTSSDFVFYLAESFSTYHDPEIIVYQYERTSAEKYPWGISNKATSDSAVIYQTLSDNA